MSVIEVRVPDIGDFKEVEVIEVLVKSGDTVKAEQSLVTVESDKASMEIPSSAAGVIKELKVALGSKVSEGSVLALLESAASRPAAAPAPVAPAAPASTAPVPPAPSSEPPPEPPPEPPSATQPAPAAAGTLVEARVPDIGDFKDVEVIELLVREGATVALDQSLITVESDKASMEIPSSVAGTLRQMRVKLGDRISEGSVIALVESGAGAPIAAPAPPGAKAPGSEAQIAAAAPDAAPVAAPAAAPVAAPIAAPAAPVAAGRTPRAPVIAGALPHASPSVRKFARELGVDLARVNGSGPKGRITHVDVQAFVKSALARDPGGVAPQVKEGMSVLALPPWPSLDFSKFGATETVALSRIKKISGPNLARNWAMIPHVTQFEEADVTALEELRKATNEALAKQGTKVTMLAFVMRACVAALKKFPNFNASLDDSGAHLILKKYIHLGFAADTPNGLVVPVVRDCDQKGITEIARATAELAAKAREGKLSPGEMQGASFTISSLGGIGGTAFTPIINAPEVAILGLSKSEIKPKWNGTEFVPRLMLPLSLSYDHRVVDGAQAAHFTTYLAELLGDMRRALL